MSEFVEATSSASGAPSGGMGFVRDVLSRGLSADRAEALLERIQDPVQPFSFILGADRRQVVTFLAEEHPQTVALVLSTCHRAPPPTSSASSRRRCRATWPAASSRSSARRRTS